MQGNVKHNRRTAVRRADICAKGRHVVPGRAPPLICAAMRLRLR